MKENLHLFGMDPFQTISFATTNHWETPTPLFLVCRWSALKDQHLVVIQYYKPKNNKMSTGNLPILTKPNGSTSNQVTPVPVEPTRSLTIQTKRRMSIIPPPIDPLEQLVCIICMEESIPPYVRLTRSSPTQPNPF